jgi:DeoR/GlpR family transcriptional regulator of sugar metabolism
VRVCEADAIDHIVTDGSLPPEARAAIDEAEIGVTIA